MKARCLYEPARALFGRWGRLVPRVPFSSDALGMPWELMGVYKFFGNCTLNLVLHRVVKQHVGRISGAFLAHIGKLCRVTTIY
mgnify:FL=1